MTETPDSTPDAPATKKRGGGLSSMLLADLKSMASGMGIPGAGSMKKAQLVEAVKAAQDSSRAAAAARQQEAKQETAKPSSEERPAEGGSAAGGPADETTAGPPRVQVRQRTRQRAKPPQSDDTRATDGKEPAEADGAETSEPRVTLTRQGDQGQAGQEKDGQEKDGQDQRDKGEGNQGQRDRGQNERGQNERAQNERAQGNKGQNEKSQGNKGQGNKDQGNKDQNEKSQGEKSKQAPGRQGQGNESQNNQGQNNQGQNDNDGDDDGEGGSRRNRRRRGRERTVTRQGRGEPDTSILEDDVLVPAAGILDVLDNYAFVRTSGYLPGTDDVYLSLSMVRKYGLRRGDAVVGQVRQPREGERREKFNPMVRIDTVNGADPEASKDRPDFAAGTPVHPDQRLRLSTDSDNVIGRVIDVVTPIGKGQRGLIYAPPASGTTPLMRSIATSITTNNPECHVMVVLVDERPEEVTDYQRSVKGEVIASTFDRQPADHVMVAELSIERAKRLVELGHDVVVLLDSITRLGRAYNLLAPANGRVLAAGVDASAIHPPKQFFGAARNLEDGGSLTILATVSDSGAAIDELFVEELAGTSNLELHLTRERAALGLTPAVDPSISATRHEDLLLAPAEAAVVGDVRRKLGDATTQGALEKVVGGFR